MSPTTLWLIAGIVFLALEALGLPGVGFVFAGLGALLVGMLVSFGIVASDAMVAQWTLFFVATALFAVMLWKPLKKFRVNQKSHSYHNMIGDTAYIGSQGLKAGAIGEVTWSGTIMRAELAKNLSVHELAAGAAVTIVGVEGAKLIVKPK